MWPPLAAKEVGAGRLHCSKDASMPSRILTLSLALAAALTLSACGNTIRGAGQDIGNTVDATGDAVDEVVR